MSDETFTRLEMEAALCVWEWINEITLLDARQSDAGWIELRSNVGSVELRHASMELGKWCLQVYDICTADDPDVFDAHPYDFEVIPAIMQHARNADGPIYRATDLPNPATVAANVRAYFAERDRETVTA